MCVAMASPLGTYREFRRNVETYTRGIRSMDMGRALIGRNVKALEHHYAQVERKLREIQDHMLIIERHCLEIEHGVVLRTKKGRDSGQDFDREKCNSLVQQRIEQFDTNGKETLMQRASSEEGLLSAAESGKCPTGDKHWKMLLFKTKSSESLMKTSSLQVTF